MNIQARKQEMVFETENHWKNYYELYKERVEEFKKRGEFLHAAIWLCEVAIWEKRSGLTEEADKCLEEAISYVKEYTKKDKYSQCVFQYITGFSLAFNNEYSEAATEHLEKALEIALNIRLYSKNIIYIFICCELGRCYAESREFSVAIDLYKNAMEYAITKYDFKNYEDVKARIIGVLHNNIAKCYLSLKIDKIDEALNCYNKSIGYFEEAKDIVSLVGIHANVVRAYMLRGDPGDIAEAEKKIIEGEKYARLMETQQIHNPYFLCLLWNNFGTVLLESELYLFSWDNVPGSDDERLVSFLRDDLNISWAENAEIRKSGDRKTICIFKDKNSAEIEIDEEKEKVTLNISDGRIHSLKVKKENGKLNIYSKFYEKAIEMYHNAYEKAEEIKSDRIEAIVQNNIGYSYLMQNHYDLATERFVEALHKAVAAKELNLIHRIHKNMAETLCKQEGYQSFPDDTCIGTYDSSMLPSYEKFVKDPFPIERLKWIEPIKASIMLPFVILVVSSIIILAYSFISPNMHVFERVAAIGLLITVIGTFLIRIMYRGWYT